MANNKINSKQVTNKRSVNTKSSNNATIMKTLVVLGVIILFVSLLYLMNYFFVEKNHIKINMSTDKKLEYVKISGKDELITTQKYVSDLDYSMRYDVNNFRVFKYRKQDYFKFLDEDKILVIVEKSDLPKGCIINEDTKGYSKCNLTVDSYTEELYITSNDVTYKITIKNPNTEEYFSKVKAKIDYMVNSFEITKK